jgi:tetratricopeptide (TPR) repeat protein
MSHTIRHIIFRILTFACVGLSNALLAQSFPLSENSWNNPDFVKRFLGSYGVRTEVEPPALTREEGRLYNEKILPPAQDGRFAEVVAELVKVITPESNANFDFTLATIYIQLDSIDDAIIHYSTAIRKFPKFLRAYKNLGFAHTRKGNHADAVTMLAKAIELGDAHGDTFGLLAYNYYNLGQYSAALDAYRMATLLNNTNIDWQIGKARALLETRRYEEAIAATDELLAKTPSDVRYWLNRVNAYIGMGQYEDAATSLEVIRRMGNAPVSSLQLLGDIYVNLGLPDLALTPYLEVVARNAPAAEVLRLARNLADRAHHTQAERMAVAIRQRHFTAMSDQLKSSLLNLEAMLAFARGDSQQGITVLQALLEVNPLDAAALLLLAKHYASDNDAEQAAYYFERVQAVGGEDQKFEAFVQHAVMLTRQNAFKPAADLLRAALRVRFEQRIATYLEAVEAAASRS